MTGDPPSPEPPKRPYTTPKLVKLGSVRALTLGSNAGFAEGAGTFRNAM